MTLEQPVDPTAKWLEDFKTIETAQHKDYPEPLTTVTTEIIFIDEDSDQRVNARLDIQYIPITQYISKASIYELKNRFANLKILDGSVLKIIFDIIHTNLLKDSGDVQTMMLRIDMSYDDALGNTVAQQITSADLTQDVEIVTSL